MRLLIDGKTIKIQNFVEYLIENYSKKGKIYEFEIHIDDKYDRKMLEKRETSLKDNILVMHSDGFDILGKEYVNDLGKFKEKIKQLLDNDLVIENFNDENFADQFIHYKIIFIEKEQKHQFDFSFINLSV
jgi:hypothetical protein